MKRGPNRKSKAALGLVAMSVAAVVGKSLEPLVGSPPVSTLFVLVLGCITFLVVFVLGLSIVGGPGVGRPPRR